MVPDARLLNWAALVGLPPALLLAAVPEAWPVAATIWSAFVAVAIVDAALAPRRLSSLTLEMPALVRLTHDCEGALEIRVSRPGRDATAAIGFDLRLAPLLPLDLESPAPEAEVSFGRGPTTVASIPCTPRRRGAFRIDTCRAECASPLGWWRLRRSLTVDCEVRAYPNLLAERRYVPALFLYRGRAGGHRQRQVGKGREFEKLRDYLPGDSYEDVHWKATARRGKPVTKLFQVEHTQEVYVVLDISRLSARPSGADFDDANDSNSSKNSVGRSRTVPALERTIRAALVLGLAAERQGDLFGLVTFGDRVQSFVRARTGAAHFQACREALYALTPQTSSPDFDELASFLRLRLRRRALLIVLTDLDDPLLAESFQRAVDLVRRQHLVLVCAMRPRDMAPMFSRPVAKPDDLYDELAGHLRWQEQRELGQALQRRGVSYAMLEAESLCAEVVSRYSSIKQRQIL